MIIVKIGILGIVVTVFCVYIKAKQPEVATVLALLCCITIFSFVLTKLETIIDCLNTLRDAINLDNKYLAILVKIIGITYVAEFSAAICNDAGYKAIGNQIELFGKLTIIALSMPIVLALLETITTCLTL